MGTTFKNNFGRSSALTDSSGIMRTYPYGFDPTTGRLLIEEKNTAKAVPVGTTTLGNANSFWKRVRLFGGASGGNYTIKEGANTLEGPFAIAAGEVKDIFIDAVMPTGAVIVTTGTVTGWAIGRWTP